MGKYSQGMRRRTEEVKLSGVVICLARINVWEFCEFQKWLRAERKKKFTESADEYMAFLQKMGFDDPAVILDKMDSRINDIGMEEIEEALDTVEGIGYLAYLSAQHKQPEMTPEEMMQLLDLEDVEKVTKAAFPPKFITKMKAEAAEEPPADDAEKKTAVTTETTK